MDRTLMELKYENLSFYNGKKITEIVELNNILISLTKSLSETKILIEQEAEFADLPVINSILSLSQFMLNQKIEDTP